MFSRVGLVFLTSCLCLLGGTGLLEATSSGAAPGSGLVLERIGVFDQPVYVAQAPGGPLMVVEQSGKIKARSNGAWKTFADFSGKVSCCGEQGLLGLAFAPDYRKSRRLYVNYTGPGGDTRIVELRRSRSSQTKAAAGRRLVLKVGQPYANHNGGQLEFGPDGYLYIGLGDGGDGGDPHNHAQDRGSRLGKILRIDPTAKHNRRGQIVKPYRVARSNPFVGRSGDDLIYAYGLRNPWRFSFDSSGKRDYLAIGDVGQGSFEEIDYVRLAKARGADFGWSRFEGFGLYALAIGPGSAGADLHLLPQRWRVRGHWRLRRASGRAGRSPRPLLVRRLLRRTAAQSDPRHPAARRVTAGRVRSRAAVIVRARSRRPPVRDLFVGPVYRIHAGRSAAPARLQVRESEWEMTLSRTEIASGPVIIEVLNIGEDPHDAMIERVGSGEPPTVLSAELDPGGLAQAELELDPGTYRLWCAISGHDALGMSATLVVN